MVETAHQVVVVYDDAGKVVHVHEAVTMAGGHLVTAADAEQRALAHAAGQGHDVARLRALHVGAGALKPRMLYRVDPASGKLIEKAAPLGGRRP